MSRRDYLGRMRREPHTSRRYRNPYFRTEQKTIPWKVLLFTGTLCAVCIGGTLFFFRSPIFTLKEISITGASPTNTEVLHALAEEEFSTTVFLFFHRSNRFLFSTARLQERITKQYAFETLELKQTGSALTIHVEEKTPQLIWMSGSQAYLVDRHGIVIRALTVEEQESLTPAQASVTDGTEPIISGVIPETDTAPIPTSSEAVLTDVDITSPTGTNSESVVPAENTLQTLPWFTDLNNQEIQIGVAVLSQEEIDGIFRFHDHLRAQAIPFLETRVDRLAGKWMGVQTQEGYEILFDPVSDVDAQAAHLDTLLHETIGNREGLRYIDLRFGDHVYYKFD